VLTTRAAASTPRASCAVRLLHFPGPFTLMAGRTNRGRRNAALVALATARLLNVGRFTPKQVPTLA
jgi:hypothetical protein